MSSYLEGNTFFYRWGANNVAITIDDMEVGREIITVLNAAQGID